MFMYIWRYKNDICDDILISSDEEYLTGLWFEGSKDSLKHNNNYIFKKSPVIEMTCKWLDIYFKGEKPDFIPKYRIDNLTSFRKEVIDIMNTISYGELITYNDIAKIIAKRRGIKKMSSQAVGGAVGWNPICIIIPCHRVVGVNNNLTGYGGEIDNKINLLDLEGINTKDFYYKGS